MLKMPIIALFGNAAISLTFMLNVTHFEIVAYIALFSVVFCDMLTRPKMIFGWYGTWLDKIEANGYEYLARLLGYCAKCTAGQIAMWVFAARKFYGWEQNSLALVRGICFVCAAVLSAEVLSKFMAKLSRG